MEKLFTLLELQHQAQEAPSRDALLHVIVNETKKLIPYSQAVFWSVEGLTLKLEKVSGNATLDSQGTYATDLKKSVKAEMKSPQTTVAILHRERHGSDGAIIMFRTTEEGLLGGLWLENTNPYNDAEKMILDELGRVYAQGLALWSMRGNRFILSSFKGKKIAPMALGALALLALFPVRLGITAPAEIVAKEAEIITVPFDGVIETIYVDPGDAVKEGDLLVTMESQSLQAQMDMAQQEILVVQSALSRVQRESLAAPEKKTGLTELQQDIESKKISYEYAKELKDRSTITAKRDGIAVFSESHSLRGKPARTGDKIMMIANPSEYELLIRVPVDSMITLQPDAKANFFLNISPLNGHSANIKSIGYQASPDADGLMTYKIIAQLPKVEEDMRIGWKGTAKIKGDWSILSYAILRRPIIGFRNLLGV